MEQKNGSGANDRPKHKINFFESPHRRILVADDDAIFLNEFEELLKEHGFLVDLAIDGEACLDLAERKPPDLILLDIAMPRMSGLDVLRKLTDDPVLEHIPVVVISGKASKNDLPTDFRLRISSFFSKPFDLNALLSAIELLLA